MHTIPRFLILGAVGWAVWGGGTGRAATVSGSGSHDAWLTQHSLRLLSVGADVEQQQRDIVLNGQSQATALESRYYSGYLGLDLSRWATLFGTIGASDARLNADDYSTGRTKWSAGLTAHWWQFDIADPSFMAGRLEFLSTLEYGRYRAGTDTDTQFDWHEWFVDLLANYEIFVEKPDDLDAYPYSLVLFAGPAWSNIKGDLRTVSAAADTSFEDDRRIGLVAGATLFASYNLSLTGQIEYFDNVSAGASLRYHF